MKRIEYHWYNLTAIKSAITIFICAIVTSSLSGCELMNREDYLAKSNRTERETADNLMQTIVDALEVQDAESLKQLFSTYAIENSQDIEEEIQEFIS